MLTAKEARAQMPDKDKIVRDNIQSICNDISFAAQRGLEQIYVPITFNYVAATAVGLRELGYIVQCETTHITVSWEEQQ